jgi:hypothetical protein
MIHAFLITLAVIAAIYAWPFILLGLCLCFKILTSKWFWLGILGLTLFIISCAFLGPITFLVLAVAYGIWQLTEFNKRLENGREGIRRAYASGELVLHNETNGSVDPRNAFQKFFNWDYKAEIIYRDIPQPVQVPHGYVLGYKCLLKAPPAPRVEETEDLSLKLSNFKMK